MRALVLVGVIALMGLPKAWGQFNVVPDTIWREMYYNGSGNPIEIYIFRNKGNPRIREIYRLISQTNWELSQKDTLFLDNNNGRITRYAVKQYYNPSPGVTDSTLYHILVSYPSPTQATFIAEGWDTLQNQWQPVVKIVGVGVETSPEHILSGWWQEFLFGNYLPQPYLYKTTHLGDTLYYYEWDSLSSDWSLLYSYARKPGQGGACDSLTDMGSQSAYPWSLCFDAQGYLISSRDTFHSTGDTSARYRYLFYDSNRRVVVDSTNRFRYDGQGQISNHSRELRLYTYTANGGLDSVEYRTYQSAGGLILRQGGNLPIPLPQRLARFRPAVPEENTRLTQVDTIVERYRFVYSTPASVASAFRPGCFVFLNGLREGRFSCLSPMEKLPLSLHDLTGRMVWQGEVSYAQPTFRLPESLPAGLYFLRTKQYSEKLYLLP